MEGLNKFREAFEQFSDNYIVIGGTACDITMRGTVVRPRATHDIDMIIIVENITTQFVEQLWRFVHDGGYRPERRRLPDNVLPHYELYRFVNGRPGYPEMIELLARHQDSIEVPLGLTIEAIQMDDDAYSLSAIVMDDDFYRFTIKHSKLTDGIRHADSAALIALKARAYLNLLADKSRGLHVNTKDIKKHRSDILKNVVIMPGNQVEAPHTIVSCINEFVTSIRNDWDEIAYPLAASLDQDVSFVKALVDQLAVLFITE